MKPILRDWGKQTNEVLIISNDLGTKAQKYAHAINLAFHSPRIRYTWNFHYVLPLPDLYFKKIWAKTLCCSQFSIKKEMAFILRTIFLSLNWLLRRTKHSPQSHSEAVHSFLGMEKMWARKPAKPFWTIQPNTQKRWSPSPTRFSTARSSGRCIRHGCPSGKPGASVLSLPAPLLWKYIPAAPRNALWELCSYWKPWNSRVWRNPGGQKNTDKIWFGHLLVVTCLTGLWHWVKLCEWWLVQKHAGRPMPIQCLFPREPSCQQKGRSKQLGLVSLLPILHPYPCQHVGKSYLVLTPCHLVLSLRGRQLPECLQEWNSWGRVASYYVRTRLSIWFGVSSEDPLVAEGRVPPFLVLETQEQMDPPTLNRTEWVAGDYMGWCCPKQSLA